MTSRQDKTRSPAPNRLAQLYQQQAIWELTRDRGKNMMEQADRFLVTIRREIKRACGDAVVREEE